MAGPVWLGPTPTPPRSVCRETSGLPRGASATVPLPTAAPAPWPPPVVPSPRPSATVALLRANPRARVVGGHHQEVTVAFHCQPQPGSDPSTWGVTPQDP